MKSVVILFVCAALAAPGWAVEPTTALLIIDIQDFYFRGGAVPLVEPEAAAANAARVLAAFRAAGRPVLHVRHDVEPGGEIYTSVAPVEGEKVFTKSEVSCFNGTRVLAYLKEMGVERLVIVGMQTHMCLEAATRAAYDLGFECVVIGDACATRDLKYGDTIVKAADVHASTLATLDGNYAKVVNTETFPGGRLSSVAVGFVGGSFRARHSKVHAT
jgi:nicotinamidase-related amidase